MLDIILESVRTVVIIVILFVLLHKGEKRFKGNNAGWRLILSGFVLLAFGSILDITDNFETLNRFVIIGDTEVEAFLEKMVGSLGGFIFLALGFIVWLPSVIGVERLKEANASLEIKVQERTDSLESVNASLEIMVQNRTQELEETITQLENANQTMMGREMRVLELKQQINELLEELGKPKMFMV